MKRIPYTPFWPRVDRSAGADGCWPWTAARDPHEYGVVSVRPSGGDRKRTRFAHRIAYELEVGPIPEGLCVCHRCDNPPCCNPAHLFLGTQADNLHDMKVKGRARGNGGIHGEAHALSKLTVEKVLLIRQLVREGGTQTAIARDLGVARPTVGHVVAGRTWRSVA